MASTAPLGGAGTSDGRIRRGERSREAIVEALIGLIGSGILQPTAQQLAERAGVGIRSVFRHFTEMDKLYAAMGNRLAADATRILASGRREGGIRGRGGALVRQRNALFERIAPFKRSGNLQRWRSAFLQERHLRMQRLLRADLLRWLPELDATGTPPDLLEAVDLAVSFEAWDRLRGDRQLHPRVAAAAMERTVLALVSNPAPASRGPG